jgi:hypothetical protein
MPVLISLAVVDIMDAFFFYESNLAPRERKVAGIMPSAVRGAASPWFTGAGSETCVSLKYL